MENEEQRSQTLESLADDLMEWTRKKTEAQAAEKEANKKIEEIEAVFFAAMGTLERVTYAGHNFKPRVNSYPSVNKENEWEFNGWLFEHDFRLTVHASSLKGWYNAHADLYAEELSDKKYLNVFEKIKIGITKAGK